MSPHTLTALQHCWQFHPHLGVAGRPPWFTGLRPSPRAGTRRGRTQGDPDHDEDCGHHTVLWKATRQAADAGTRAGHGRPRGFRVGGFGFWQLMGNRGLAPPAPKRLSTLVSHSAKDLAHHQHHTVFGLADGGLFRRDGARPVQHTPAAGRRRFSLKHGLGAWRRFARQRPGLGARVCGFALAARFGPCFGGYFGAALQHRTASRPQPEAPTQPPRGALGGASGAARGTGLGTARPSRTTAGGRRHTHQPSAPLCTAPPSSTERKRAPRKGPVGALPTQQPSGRSSEGRGRGLGLRPARFGPCFGAGAALQHRTASRPQPKLPTQPPRQGGPGGGRPTQQPPPWLATARHTLPRHTRAPAPGPSAPAASCATPGARPPLPPRRALGRPEAHTNAPHRSKAQPTRPPT